MNLPRILSFNGAEEARCRLLSYGVAAADAQSLSLRLREFLFCVPHPSGDPIPPSAVSSVPYARGAKGEFLLFADRDEARSLPLPGLERAVERRLAVPSTVRCGDRTLAIGRRPAVMGILNVTPDSFSDGGRWRSVDDAVRHALDMIRDGADIVDVGGESTRPGSIPVPPELQIERVLPVIRAVAAMAPDAILSVDTTSALVADQALAGGASMVNDTSALDDDGEMASVIRRHGAAVILMHRKGPPSTMQVYPFYDCFMKEMVEEMEGKAILAEQGGVDPGRIFLDPGIGFGKRPEDNLEAHRYLGDLCALGYPVAFGSSRKSVLGHIDGKPPGERIHTSVASAVLAAWNGASLLRVHDVAATREALDLVGAVRSGGAP